MQIFEQRELPTADLLVDAVYQGGRRGSAGDDPLPSLLDVSTGGGFRYRGSIDALELVVLTSNKRDPDWPDELDRETGIYTYYGDNKVPGRDLHGTRRFGNQILCRVFEDALGGQDGRRRVHPILAFASSGAWRDVVFLGLAVPGTEGGNRSEDLVAIWRTRDNRRFQNYRARFTILKAEVISRAWLSSILRRQPDATLAPEAWSRWTTSGQITPLLAPRTIQHRTRRQQVPTDTAEIEMVRTIYEFFSTDPFAFEACAAELAKMMLPNIALLDLTRRTRDGGRDGIGKYRIGNGPGAILVGFALETKCYAPQHAVGVREMSRLISRLRHRQFGVLVTTSCVDGQAYREIKEDQHPIVVISAIDIARLLKERGYGSPDAVRTWLTHSFQPRL